MTRTLTTCAALLLSTTLASAGGLDRSGQSVAALFEAGNYIEGSIGYVMPQVSGVDPTAKSSGDMAQDYFPLGFAIKTDVNDRVSLAFIYDKAFGAAIDYSGEDVGYGFGGIPPAAAELSGNSLTALARYRINDRFAVHAGLRSVTMSGQIDFTAAAGPVIDYGADTDVGYVVGGTYEIPAIALRAALTYSSATEFMNNKTVGGTTIGSTNRYTMPQSVNLDFQTGIAADTLLLASVRWADWSATSLDTSNGTLGLGVIDYSHDSYTYSVGVGRRFSDQLSGVARITYEASDGELASNLSPTDGSIGLTLGGVYTMDNVKLTGGISYVKLGNATTEIVSSEFRDNYAIGVGFKISTTF